MNTPKKFATAFALIIFQSFGAVNAAPVDEELAQISTEQQNPSDRVEIFDPNPEPPRKETKPKTQKEILEEQKRLEEERRAARKKIEEERQRIRDEMDGKTTIEPAETEPTPAVDQPNPVTTYASFEEIVRALNFTPLYVPKKSGYTISSITSIDNRLAEIRYGRRWEPTVLLHVRTYRRADDEELKDVSGINGVKWRTNVVNGVTVYIAKIDENNHAAAWAVGNYTFSAYVENMSFAAFHSFVSDELVDLSQHYYLN